MDLEKLGRCLKSNVDNSKHEKQEMHPKVSQIIDETATDGNCFETIN